MELDKINDLRAKHRIACNDANRVGGLTHNDGSASGEWQENVASCLDKLCEIVGALIEECAPSKHAQAVAEMLKPGELDARD